MRTVLADILPERWRRVGTAGERPSADGSRAVPLLDTEELAERMVKWAWLGGMLFLLSLFMPAVRGGQASNRPWTLAGWEMAYLAHVGFVELARSEADSAVVVRRIRPLSQTQAMGLAGAAVLSNWLTVAAGLMVYVGYRTGNPRRWGALAARAALYAAVLGLASTLIWLTARNLMPLAGCVLWCLSPVVMWWGMWRLSRQA
ncbi:MAG: hypothetical protein ACK4PI_09360 [Tepidisphaerales bacterium]